MFLVVWDRLGVSLQPAGPLAGPTFTSLVCPSNSVDEVRQQALIDAAGARVASKAERAGGPRDAGLQWKA